MDLTPFAVIDGALEEKYKHVLSTLTRNPLVINNNQFPGAQPVSIQVLDLKRLFPVNKESPFLVCEKSDGVRYLLLTRDQRVVLVDRDVKFFDVTEMFPVPPGGQIAQNTVLDGELVQEDKMGEEASAATTFAFWIFDAICVSTIFVGDLSLTNRLRVVAGEVILPSGRTSTTMIPRGWTSARGFPQIHLMLKPMFSGKQAPYIWDHVIPKLPHANDGLIFTKNEAVYKYGTNHDIVKWKPAEMNSIDFEIAVIWRRDDDNKRSQKYAALWVTRQSFRQQYPNSHAPEFIFLDDTEQEMLLQEGRDRLMSKSRDASPLREGTTFPPLIIECYRDPNWFSLVLPEGEDSRWSTVALSDPTVSKGGWRLMRIRKDRNRPNDLSTVQNVLNSIENPVDIEMLRRACT